MQSHHSQSVAFMFAGQGNPVIGMGSDLWDLNDAIRQIWDCASDISQTDIRRLCLKGPMNKLVKTTHQQMAVTAINATLYTLCRDKINFDKVVSFCGHSVGEYAALYAANAVTLEDLFKMIHFRGQLMDELSKVSKGAMYVVKNIDYQTITHLIARCGIDLDVSCDNSRRQQVIGGLCGSLNEFSSMLHHRGYNTVKLGVSGAWHTRLMVDGVQRMRDFLARVEIQSPQYEVLMNVTGQAETDPQTIKQNLSLHLTHTVKWTDSMERLLGHHSAPLLIEVSNKAYLGYMLNDFSRFTPEMTLHCRKI